MKIAVSGDLGSGKSVLCKRLSKYLHCRILSMGVLQREMAQKHDMDILEYNKYSESHPELDKERDACLVQLAQQENDVIIDSRLAWHFVPDTFKIHLLVNREVAAKRIAGDNRETEIYQTIEEAVSKLQERKASENKRFLSLYGVDCDCFDNYDLVIDTTAAAPGIILETTLEIIKNPSINPSNLWLSAKNIFPASLVSSSMNQTEEPVSHIAMTPISVVQYADSFFIVDGLERLHSALQENINLIPVKLIEQLSDEFDVNSFSMKFIKEWEEIHSFKFLHYPKL